MPVPISVCGTGSPVSSASVLNLRRRPARPAPGQDQRTLGRAKLLGDGVRPSLAERRAVDGR